jgi:hypothetical protein
MTLMSVIPWAFVGELEAMNRNADRFDFFPVIDSRPMARLSDGCHTSQAGRHTEPDRQVPQTPNGQPDLSGLWMPEGDPTPGRPILCPASSSTYSAV